MLDEEKDWLAQELKYESRISAWDLDEPNKIKRYHEDNCPREKLAEEHIRMHDGNEKGRTIQARTIKSNIMQNSEQSTQAKRLANIISIFVVFMFLVMMLNMLFG